MLYAGLDLHLPDGQRLRACCCCACCFFSMDRNTDLIRFIDPVHDVFKESGFLPDVYRPLKVRSSSGYALSRHPVITARSKPQPRYRTTRAFPFDYVLLTDNVSNIKCWRMNGGRDVILGRVRDVFTRSKGSEDNLLPTVYNLPANNVTLQQSGSSSTGIANPWLYLGPHIPVHLLQ